MPCSGSEEIYGACANHCGDPETGDCCVPQRGPGRNNADYCERVCVGDPFCCEIERDTRCVGAAPELCEACAAPDDLDGNGTTGPSDLVILLYGSSRRKRRRGTERAL